MKLLPALNSTIQKALKMPISEERKLQLNVLTNYVQDKVSTNQEVRLNFICTHNSRRSQFAQLWSAVAAYLNNIPILAYSGGVEVTACNPRTINSLERFGFRIKYQIGENPPYQVLFSDEASAVVLYSKLFDDNANPKSGFAAIMTCSHADENCPFVSGCEKRLSLTYKDPKDFDNSSIENAQYDATSLKIAAEMLYVFSKIK